MPAPGGAAAPGGGSPDVLLHELNRLRSELKSKNATIEVRAGTLEPLRSAPLCCCCWRSVSLTPPCTHPPPPPAQEQSVEVTTLQRLVRAAQDGASAAEAQLAAARERVLRAEGEASNVKKQLAAAQAERDSLRRELDDEERGALR